MVRCVEIFWLLCRPPTGPPSFPVPGDPDLAIHCPKNYLNIPISKASLSFLEWINCLCPAFVFLTLKPDIYCCICFNRDRLGFCAEIEIYWYSVVKSFL